MVPQERAGAILTIDLEAIVENWRLLSARLGEAACGAVVKADAYGLGACRVAAALEAAGCRSFFVALLDEGVALRKALSAGSRIFVLNGTPQGMEGDFIAARLIPVVNTLGELAAWQERARAAGCFLPVALQVDSGMSRLGLAPSDAEKIWNDPSLLDGLSIELVMSHLACADEPGHPANEAQRKNFERLRAVLPAAPASLANSSGIFLGAPYHYEVARPGAALYGINPTSSCENPMRPVIRLSARVIQIRDIPEDTAIGYGQAAMTQRASRLATISLGYADGWPRNAAAAAFYQGVRLPFAGRVSMDSIILDITDGARQPREGDMVDLICEEQKVDDVARAAGTIGYEILTRLGRRFHRRYIDTNAGPVSVDDFKE
ncbi:alanine racemase [Chelativorans sp. Marseille-P2723]|uniref:alanine racemase n=1 Tax=Chelativorans sp. Marseille-P2723 TaxID=2709133 RepID=UPI00156FCCC5|nr:alanine racemase [Chelativorans sp. Marseille-P2723]